MDSRSKSTSRAVFGCIVTMAAIAFVGFFREWPGGMGSSYRAKDYDQRLTQLASSAKPMIDALALYYRNHGTFPPDLPPSSEPQKSQPTEAARAWFYTPETSSSAYQLYRKLGWDPSLLYRFDGTHGHWIFNPGDGRPEKEIQLTP